MNNLSWMIYLAGAAGNVGTLFTIAAVISSIIGGFVLLICGINASVERRDTAFLWDWGKRLAFIIAPCALLAALTPSSTTIYAIAASEMGEKALNTQTGGKAVQALNAWLDEQISGDDDKD